MATSAFFSLQHRARTHSDQSEVGHILAKIILYISSETATLALQKRQVSWKSICHGGAGLQLKGGLSEAGPEDGLRSVRLSLHPQILRKKPTVICPKRNRKTHLLEVPDSSVDTQFDNCIISRRRISRMDGLRQMLGFGEQCYRRLKLQHSVHHCNISRLNQTVETILFATVKLPWNF